MSYRTIMTHIGSTEEAGACLRLSVHLAQRFDAALIGLGTSGFDAWPDPTGISVQAVKKEIERTLRESEKLFHETAGSLSQGATWRSATEFPAPALIGHASSADLIICSRSTGNEPAQAFADPGELIIQAGVPVLALAPEVDRLEARNIVIGWKDTRESRRAIWDALPFLKRADAVHVVQVVSQGEDGAEPGVDPVIERLRRHGVDARGQAVRETASSIALDLIDAANALDSDLIVVGGYGRSRGHEWVFGGMTRDLLAGSTKCVLFSH